MAEAEPKSSGGEWSFQKKIGPLPVWGWVGIAAGGALLYWWWKNRQSSTSNTTSDTGTGSASSGGIDYGPQIGTLQSEIGDLQSGQGQQQSGSGGSGGAPTTVTTGGGTGNTGTGSTTPPPPTTPTPTPTPIAGGGGTPGPIANPPPVITPPTPTPAPSPSPSPAPSVTVPATVGSTATVAGTRLKAAGFNVAFVTAGTKGATNIVTATNPPAGAKAPKGSTVNVHTAPKYAASPTSRTTGPVTGPVK